jgi:hypothetical protein
MRLRAPGHPGFSCTRSLDLAMLTEPTGAQREAFNLLGTVIPLNLK